jgi:2-polyprenyl-3-methyl-5-hydroxy-6-metoxy-1,4-benzoquinol methylase
MRQFRKPELMDDPALDARQHARALRGLRAINRFSRSARIVWRPIERLIQSGNVRSLRVLDVATGAGDVPVALSRLARRSGLNLSIEGCDRSFTALAQAKHHADAANADVHFFQLDVLNNELPDGYDVIVCSLFLHHLDPKDAIDLLRKMSRAARRMIVINDLRRSRGGLLLAHAATRLLTTSHVVHVDGPRSVHAAYTIPEVRELARAAGMRSVSIVRRFPFRLLLTWQRPR